ncbi:MAG TPA: STAS domain-containing protein [Acidimicrobiales bacterium]|nr:STAS domain-containing protein [Acidimicrobiales bacterium]
MHFRIATNWIANQVHLAIKGSIDASSAPSFVAAFDDAVVSKSASVIIDLTELDSIDSAGLEAIENMASILADSGGQLTIRSPSEMAGRILEFTGPAYRLCFELVGERHDQVIPLAPQQQCIAKIDTPMIAISSQYPLVIE